MLCNECFASRTCHSHLVSGLTLERRFVTKAVLALWQCVVRKLYKRVVAKKGATDNAVISILN